MQTLNRYVGGRQEVGHIDLLDTISYFEVPEKDARKVMTQLTGIRYKGRVVRCNAEDDKAKANESYKTNESYGSYRTNKAHEPQRSHRKDDWRELMKPRSKKELKGEIPDFSEEGWARRKPKKK
jgi:ATP-dependent RNA helicase DeaD